MSVEEPSEGPLDRHTSHFLLREPGFIAIFNGDVFPATVTGLGENHRNDPRKNVSCGNQRNLKLLKSSSMTESGMKYVGQPILFA